RGHSENPSLGPIANRFGGSGGGGGGRAECHTQTIDVIAGQRLSWVIGQGGTGGFAAIHQGQPNQAQAREGLSGGQTFVMLNGQVVGPTASGGLGGKRGHNGSEL